MQSVGESSCATGNNLIMIFLPTFTDIFNGCIAFINSSVTPRSGTLRQECSEIGVDGQTEFKKSPEIVTCIVESFVKRCSELAS
jgi:hypothetical protein